ncbi:MAG: hypothetical protein RL329_446 [Bacteroidota bacterium]|jgi:hypothetical protein
MNQQTRFLAANNSPPSLGCRLLQKLFFHQNLKRMKFKWLFFNCLVIINLGVACRKTPDPCAGRTPDAKDFQMYMTFKNPGGLGIIDTFRVPQQLDTFYGSQAYSGFLPTMVFESDLVTAQTFKWTVGTDARVFTNPKFSLSFRTPPNLVNKIDVKLLRERSTDVCFPNDNGKDTIQKSFYLANDQILIPPQVGRFKGYIVGQEQDTFTVHIYFGSRDEAYFIDNFPKGASVVCPAVSGGYKGDFIGIIGKYFVIQSSFAFTQVQNTGLAYALGKVDKNSIEINYMTNKEPSKKQRFIGVKQP